MSLCNPDMHLWSCCTVAISSAPEHFASFHIESSFRCLLGNYTRSRERHFTNLPILDNEEWPYREDTHPLRKKYRVNKGSQTARNFDQQSSQAPHYYYCYPLKKLIRKRSHPRFGNIVIPLYLILVHILIIERSKVARFARSPSWIRA